MPFCSLFGVDCAKSSVFSAASLTGIVAVALGVLMSQLGNIFPVIFAISSAIGGPLKGVFLAGMLLPWVNVKVSHCHAH